MGGIAGLIGQCSVVEALAQAKPRFRSISADQLFFQDFEHSPTVVAPLRGIFERTKPCALGECDAFLSHSWHDSAAAKWTAFQNWRSSFIAKHGREPNIWFDKACIDQNNVEEDLKGLPVFLYGCKELLILCGPTYLERLWCIVELFTFVHVCGNTNKVTELQLCGVAAVESDQDAIQRAVDDFEAEKCACFNPLDKEKMLEIIVAAFGSMHDFNTSVRALMKRALVGDSTSSDSLEEADSISSDSLSEGA